MNTDANKDPVADKAKELFDQSVERLDAATLSRLNQGRQKALEELTRPGARVHWGRWIPATGVAAVALLAVLVMRGPVDVEPANAVVTASDFEMLLEADSLELFEDLEFYSLLDEVDADAIDNVG